MRTIFKNKIVVAIWIILIIIFRWNTFTTPFERDEGAYAFVASEFRDGILPYEETFDHKPPMIYYTYALVQEVSEEIWALRILSLFAFVVTSLLTAHVAFLINGKLTGYFALLLSVPMFSHPLLTPFAANTEVFMLPFMLFPIFLFLKYQNEANTIAYFLFGISSAVALFYKPIALGVIGFVWGIWVIKQAKKQKMAAAYLIVFSFLGVILTSLLILLPFIQAGLLDKFYEYVIVYSREVSLDPIVLRRFLRNVYILLFSWPLLVLISGFYLLKRPRMWWFFIGCLLVSIPLIFNAEVGHYYLILIPFWIIILSKSITVFSDRFKFNDYFIFVIIFLSALIPLYKQIFVSPQKFITHIYGVHQPFEEAYLMGEVLRMISSPNETVYLAGHEPEILYYSGLENASKFIYAYPLMSGPFQGEFNQEFYAEMSQELPDYIVLNSEHYQPNDERKTVQSFWNQLIRLSYEHTGSVVRDMDRVFWDTDEQQRGRLLLYKKK